jgi:hypothetical protein
MNSTGFFVSSGRRRRGPVCLYLLFLCCVVVGGKRFDCERMKKQIFFKGFWVNGRARINSQNCLLHLSFRSSFSSREIICVFSETSQTFYGVHSIISNVAFCVYDSDFMIVWENMSWSKKKNIPGRLYREEPANFCPNHSIDDPYQKTCSTGR